MEINIQKIKMGKVKSKKKQIPWNKGIKTGRIPANIEELNKQEEKNDIRRKNK